LPQLADGGPFVTPELPAGVAGPPFGGAPGSAGFLFFGSLAVNSKMLSRANHGADDANMPATIIAHIPVAITMQRLVVFIEHTSCLTLLLQNTFRYPSTVVYHNHALNSSTCRDSTCRTPSLSHNRRKQKGRRLLAAWERVRHHVVLLLSPTPSSKPRARQ